MSKEKKSLFLLDGHALVFRAHYAFINRPLYNSKGINTSAINGFVRALWDIMQNHDPTHLGVSFDLSSKTFRNDMYPAYKANRDETPEDILIALPYITSIVEAFNIPIITKPNYEADDVIGTLAKRAEAQDFHVYMVTPDKDYGQLVSDKVFMWKPSRQGNGVDVLGVPEILEIWDIAKVDQVIDVLGLQGDAVDNIPGVPGIGAKTASKLLKQYPSIEEIIAHKDELKGSVKDKITNFSEQAMLSKELATIVTDVDVPFDPDALKICPPNRARLEELFDDLEFKSIKRSVLGEQQPKATQGNLFDQPAASSEPQELPAADAPNKEHYHLIEDKKTMQAAIKKIQAAGIFSFDTETTGLNAHEDELVGFSLGIKGHSSWYIPVSKNQKEAAQAMQEWNVLFNDPKLSKIGQNAKFDISVLRRYGVEFQGPLYDTMIMHYLYEPDLRHNMDYLSESYLKYKPISIESLIGPKGKGQKTMREVPVEEVAIYAAEDADITYQLYDYFLPILQEENIAEVYHNIEEPLIPVLSQMEASGIRLDVDFLNNYSISLADQIEASKENIYQEAGTSFNISSPSQVGQVLFEKLELPYRWRKTKQGKYSTSEEKLAELGVEFPIVKEILHYRMLTKLKSTYVDALPKLADKNNLIHTSYNQALASTGRLSSNNPNLQNIPIKTEEGREVRKAFIPRSDDFILFAADYSQIELRLIASMSNETALLDAFNKNQDVHRATAAKVYGVPYEEVTDDQRRAAKTVNFSILYGAGATNLSQQLDIPRTEAKELIDQYFKEYSGLRAFMDDTVAFAREHGYVQTICGRKRKIRDINSRNGMARSAAERIAVNTPIQGSAADMIKLAMIHIDEVMRKKKMKSKMLLQVHDELVFDAYKDEFEELKEMVIDKMRSAIPELLVPIKVSVGHGNNWLEAH